MKWAKRTRIDAKKADSIDGTNRVDKADRLDKANKTNWADRGQVDVEKPDEDRVDATKFDWANGADKVDISRADVKELDQPDIAIEDPIIVAKDSSTVSEDLSI